MTRMTPEDKVAAWYRAYTAIREELTPRSARTEFAAIGKPRDLAELQAVHNTGARIAANDRTAAIVAAMLVSSGIRPILLETEPEPYVDNGEI